MIEEQTVHLKANCVSAFDSRLTDTEGSKAMDSFSKYYLFF